MKRQLIACALTIGLGCSANAEDGRIIAPVDLVPGTPTYWSWSGFYIGGQAGASHASLNPGNATSSLIAYILRHTTIENEARVSQWPQLSKTTATGHNFGGFVGYNTQWDDIILGVEVNYSFGSISNNSSDTIARSFLASDGYLYDVTVASRVAVQMKDNVTFRTRAGYVMGRFLPYAMVGAAIARADVSRSVSVTLTGTDVTNNPPLPQIGLAESATEHRRNAIIYGFSGGLGLDFGITPNVFLRGEFEYQQYFPMSGVTYGVSTGRVGAAVKF